jgi:hypothetical protein
VNPETRPVGIIVSLYVDHRKLIGQSHDIPSITPEAHLPFSGGVTTD